MATGNQKLIWSTEKRKLADKKLSKKGQLTCASTIYHQHDGFRLVEVNCPINFCDFYMIYG